MSGGQKQHVDFYRKLRLRKMLLGQAKIPKDAAAYVPYIGDGDIAAELYSDRNLRVVS